MANFSFLRTLLTALQLSWERWANPCNSCRWTLIPFRFRDTQWEITRPHSPCTCSCVLRALSFNWRPYYPDPEYIHTKRLKLIHEEHFRCSDITESRLDMDRAPGLSERQVMVWEGPRQPIGRAVGMPCTLSERSFSGRFGIY